MSCLDTRREGEGGTWVNFRWVCAAGLSEPHVDPILVTFSQKRNFLNPNLVTFWYVYIE